MKILITGINGFVGSNLVRSLSKFHTIWGLDIIDRKADGILQTYNWNELELIPAVDVIIHLAGKAHDVRGIDSRDEYFAINTELTKLIFNKFLSTSTPIFIQFSSVKAAADKVTIGMLTEDCIPVPIGSYAESKLKAEEYINSKLKEYKDKKVYILRPAMIHGPGNKGNLNLLYSFVNKGIPYPLGAFNNSRSFTSIDNLEFVISELIKGKIDNGVYNICDDQVVSTREIVEIIARVRGKKANIWNINKSLMQFLAKIGTALCLPFNTFRLAKLTEDYVVSNKKIKNAIGIDKMPLEACKGLEITINEFNK